MASWQGSGLKNTEPFYISSPWFIRWKFKSGEHGNLTVAAHRIVDGKMDDVTYAVNANKSGSDISWIYDTGTFYLVIDPMMGGKWEVSAEKPK